MKIIKYIINFFKRKRFMRKQAKSLKKFILNGKYKFNNNCYYLLLDDNETKERAINLLDEKLGERRKGLIEFIKRILSFGSVKVKGNKKVHQASIILLTHQNKSIKMFDLKNNLVITKYLIKEEYFKEIENYKHFSKYFKTPKVLKYEDDEMVITEEFINYKQTSELNKSVKHELMENIFITYKNYLIENKESIIVNNNYATLKSLGDLMYKNIFYYNNEFYFIDFELSNNNFILYDIFTFIFYAFYNNNETFYYENYINGLYDTHISELFNIAGIEFNNNMKEEYFNIFIKERIMEEKRFAEHDVKDSILNKFKELKEIIK